MTVPINKNIFITEKTIIILTPCKQNNHPQRHLLIFLQYSQSYLFLYWTFLNSLRNHTVTSLPSVYKTDLPLGLLPLPSLV